MPIDVGCRGKPAVIGNPALHHRLGMVYNTGVGRRVSNGDLAFRARPLKDGSIWITGTVKIAGVATADCEVELYRSTDHQFIARTITDVAGAYSFAILVSGPFFARATDPSGLLVGTTLDTLVGS